MLDDKAQRYADGWRPEGGLRDVVMQLLPIIFGDQSTSDEREMAASTVVEAVYPELLCDAIKSKDGGESKKLLDPIPDCGYCNGTGEPTWAKGFPCECTRACDCGQERPSGLEPCRSPGCTNVGCDACSEVEWCGNPDDEPDGDYFCSECR